MKKGYYRCGVRIKDKVIERHVRLSRTEVSESDFKPLVKNILNIPEDEEIQSIWLVKE